MTRFGFFMAAYFAAIAITISAFIHPRPRLIWNASASAPIGLYALHRTDDPPLGALVAVLPPARLAEWMAERHYLPKKVPLLKHVVAKAGQRICRIGGTITVDGAALGKAHKRDSQARGLPVWRGCRTLGHGKLFLMNPTVSDSLDSRYFGPLPASTLLGQATPLLTRDASGGALRWHGF